MTWKRNIYLEDIPLEEARERLWAALSEAGRAGPLSGERVTLPDALGRVTAEAVWALSSSPSTHVSAMDGYAVRAAETVGATETRPIRLSVPGQAFPVNTGNPLPAELDAVILIEHVQELAGQEIEIRAAVPAWRHVRPMGEDIVESEMVLPESHRVRAFDLGAVAAAGHDALAVRRRPRVAILPTGNELVPLGRVPGRGQIIESNSLVLAAQIRESGGEPRLLPITSDDLATLSSTLAATLAEAPDLVLVVGGSSAGTRDFTAAIVAEHGRVLVHGVAVRPGHPVVLGMARDIPVVGIPGYPVSAALTCELFVLPLLARWLGVADPWARRERVRAVMTQKLASPAGDDDFVRVTLARVGGALLAAPLPRGAGALSSLVRADGLAHVPRFCEGIEQGQGCEIILLKDQDTIDQTLVLQGSHDPLLDLLGQHLSRARPGMRLVSSHVGSLGGLMALRRAEAHGAGVHLLDEATGEYNLSFVKKHLPSLPLRVVTFAHREQGLIVARGNPLALLSYEDLPRARFVNRQRGAGTRVLLDIELTRRGISPGAIAGYEREEVSHLGVAAQVASGAADCGLGVRRAAVALGLDFVFLARERYDLVLPASELGSERMRRLLEVLGGETFRAELSRQPGYDASETGAVQFEQ